jgi:thioredoxin 1
MLERLVVAALILAVGTLLLRALQGFILRIKGRIPANLYQVGQPAVLYFSSPDCGPCAAVQRPELDRFARHMNGDIQVIEIDVTRDPQIADAYGVLSLPTTFLIDSYGRPRRVNMGLKYADQLREQFEAIGELNRRAS